MRAEGWNGIMLNKKGVSRINLEWGQIKLKHHCIQKGCRYGKEQRLPVGSDDGDRWRGEKWQRRVPDWGLWGGPIAWLEGKCIAEWVMLSRRILRHAARLTQSLPLVPLFSSTFLHSALSLYLTPSSPLMILAYCHTAGLSDAHWQPHSGGNTAPQPPPTPPFQEAVTYTEHIEV